MKGRHVYKKCNKIKKIYSKSPVTEKGFKSFSQKKFFKSFINIFCLFTIVGLVMPQLLMAASVTLSWNRNQEPDIAGYKVFYGTASHQYTESETINDAKHSPTQISHTVSNLSDGMTYYFSVRAFDLAGQMSDYSQEVSVSIPSSGSGSGGDEGAGDSGDSGGSGDTGGSGDDGGSETGPMELKVNFQPASALVPAGFVADSGDWYNASTGYGWVGDRPKVADYNSSRSKDQQHDTLAKANSGMKWEMAVPAGDYEVTVCIGSPVDTYLFQTVMVEGRKIFFNTSTWAAHWSEKTMKVHVSDGRLTLSFTNIPRSFIALDYVIVRGEDTVITVGQQNQPPRAIISTSTRSGQAPLDVSFNGSSSSDPDGTIVLYHWDFGDGSSQNGAVTSHVFTSAGIYNVKLTVKDDDGAVGTKTVSISVTNSGTGDSGNSGDSGDDGGSEGGPMELKVNFQPENAPVPAGFVVDSGNWYSSSTGYGWVAKRPQVVDYNSSRSKDQQHDTLAKANSSMKWEMAVPAGDYEVTVCIGSPVDSYLFQGVNVEGKQIFHNTVTWAGHWLEKTMKVHVSDGKLTLKFSNIFNSYVGLDYIIVKEK